jgi:hypothetical protein
MALCTFRTPMHPVDAQSAIRELIGHQLRKVLAADLDPPAAGPIADCLSRIAARDSAEPLQPSATHTSTHTSSGTEPSARDSGPASA